MERTYKICVLKTTSKMLDSCNIWPFYHDFHRLKSSYLFFISRILYKILDEVKLKEIVFDNFLLSIIHVFRGFFRSILWSCFYYGILLNPKSRAHFCSDWVYSSFAVIFFLVHYLMFPTEAYCCQLKKKVLCFMLYVRDTKSYVRDTKSYVRDTKSYVRDNKSYVRDSVSKSYVRDTKSYVRDN